MSAPLLVYNPALGTYLIFAPQGHECQECHTMHCFFEQTVEDKRVRCWSCASRRDG